ncbi:MAG TPA: HAD family hydrolase [Vicinamibacterales bacterium]
MTVIFDGDDTLWSTEALYDRARAEARRIVSAAGQDGAAWEALERRLDVENVGAMGYSPDRFPTSCVQAYAQICAAAGAAPDVDVVERVRRAAASVFDEEAPVVAGAEETLAALRARGARLALLTKGHPEVQARRVERSGLAKYFDMIEIVTDKSERTIIDLVHALGADVADAWMVGNSMRSDVLPALAAGLRAIWIDAHVWEHERTHDHLRDERAITAARLSDVADLLAS